MKSRKCPFVLVSGNRAEPRKSNGRHKPSSAVFPGHSSGWVNPNLYRLARSFKTSISATAIRCAELRRISVFEADKRMVLWGYGIVKKGALTSIDSGLTTALELASKGQPGQDEVYLNTASGIRKWRVEHKPIAPGRSLFLLQRVSATREAKGFLRDALAPPLGD